MRLEGAKTSAQMRAAAWFAYAPKASAKDVSNTARNDGIGKKVERGAD